MLSDTSLRFFSSLIILPGDVYAPGADLKEGKGEVTCFSPLGIILICSRSCNPGTSEKKKKKLVSKQFLFRLAYDNISL